MAKKYLITSALPYVNGSLHLGHLIGCWLPSDVYARFCRAMGRDVLYICGADEHGTPAIVGAASEGISVLEYNNKYLEKHLKAVHDFNLSFDRYGRTHTDLQEKLIHELFNCLDKQGLIEERETIQPFSVDDDMFLADRQLVGTCPKCGYDKARGDQCDKCSATYEASELINPRSTISGSSNIEMRKTKNLFFLASKVQNKWKQWLQEHSEKWSKTAKAIANGWANEQLLDTSITRDLKWGIPVNKPGYENKVFYVWFDAPWGYVSISQAATNNWAQWWKKDDTFYAQFMGKDNVKFHSIFFPEQELAMNDNWKTVDMLKAMNFLNFEGGKFSKSEKRGIFLDTAIDIAPADLWRYALLSSAPETDDSDFSIRRFADIVNKDLNGMLGNFVSRVCKLTDKNFGNYIPEGSNLDIKLKQKVDEKLIKLTQSLEQCEFREAITYLRELYAIGNEYMTIYEPWTLVKNNETDKAKHVLNNCFQLIDLYTKISAPFMPDTAIKMQKIFIKQHDLSWPLEFLAHIDSNEEFIVPDNLFTRFDEETIKNLEEKYSGNKIIKPLIVQITAVKSHPTKNDLHILTIDDGTNHNIQVVCGATNLKVGQKGVFAPLGCIINKKHIVKRNVAGIDSYGMMLSANELNINSENNNTIFELPSDANIGQEYK